MLQGHGAGIIDTAALAAAAGRAPGVAAGRTAVSTPVALHHAILQKAAAGVEQAATVSARPSIHAGAG